MGRRATNPRPGPDLTSDVEELEGATNPGPEPRSDVEKLEVAKGWRGVRAQEEDGMSHGETGRARERQDDSRKNGGRTREREDDSRKRRK